MVGSVKGKCVTMRGGLRFFVVECNHSSSIERALLLSILLLMLSLNGSYVSIFKLRMRVNINKYVFFIN